MFAPEVGAQRAPVLVLSLERVGGQRARDVRRQVSERLVDDAEVGAAQPAGVDDLDQQVVAARSQRQLDALLVGLRAAARSPTKSASSWRCDRAATTC